MYSRKLENTLASFFKTIHIEHRGEENAHGDLAQIPILIGTNTQLLYVSSFVV